MADLLATASSWMADRLRESAAHPVTYRRGEESVTVSATVGNTSLDVETSAGTIERYTSRDFIVAREDLASLAGGADPQRGDVIEDTVAGDVRRYEVAAVPGRALFEHVGPFRDMVRIHTKDRGVAA